MMVINWEGYRPAVSNVHIHTERREDTQKNVIYSSDARIGREGVLTFRRTA